MRIIVLIILMVISSVVFAQDSFIELIRSDLQTERIAVVTEAMDLTDDEASIFWPIYRDYQNEYMKLGDEELALIKEYGRSYDQLTEEKANEIVNTFFKQEENRLKLKKKYYNKFNKALSAVTAAKFVQVENQIDMVMDIQIASALPLIKRPKMENTEMK